MLIIQDHTGADGRKNFCVVEVWQPCKSSGSRRILISGIRSYQEAAQAQGALRAGKKRGHGFLGSLAQFKKLLKARPKEALK